jgi:hypothetical protein
MRTVGDGIVRHVEDFPGAVYFQAGREKGSTRMHFRLLSPYGDILHWFRVRGPVTKGMKTDHLEIFDLKDPSKEPKHKWADRKTGKLNNKSK